MNPVTALSVPLPDSWFTAVELISGAEIQIVCDGTLWINDHASFGDAIRYAVTQGFITSDEGSEVLDWLGPSFWTTKIDVEADTLRSLGFRLGGLIH